MAKKRCYIYIYDPKKEWDGFCNYYHKQMNVDQLTKTFLQNRLNKYLFLFFIKLSGKVVKLYGGMFV